MIKQKWKRPENELPEIGASLVVVHKCGGYIKCGATFGKWGFSALPGYGGHFKQSTIKFWRYA